MSSTLRSFREPPLSQACYIVRLDVNGYPVGSTPAAISAGIAAAREAGRTVEVIGNMIVTDPTVYLADYFNGDVQLYGGDLLRDMGSELVVSYQGTIYMRAKLVTKITGRHNTSGSNISPPFYVTVWESYGAGGTQNPLASGVYMSDVFVSRVS